MEKRKGKFEYILNDMQQQGIIDKAFGM